MRSTKRANSPLGAPWCAATLLSVLIILTAASASAAEFRTWTDTKGRTVIAKLVRVDDDIVLVEMKDGRKTEIKRKILSKADIDFLAEYGGQGAADVDVTAEAAVPEKTVRVDSKVFKKWDQPFQFTGLEIDFNVLETPHFLVMTSGSVREKDTAEGAEILWHGMAFQHPSFARKWEGKKMAIFIVTEASDYNAIGAWYADVLRKGGDVAEGNNMALSWPHAVSGTIGLEASQATEHNLFTQVRCFKADDPKLLTGTWAPFRTHCLAGDMLNLQMGGISNFGSAGYFALSNGHSYYKEIQLCDKTETTKVNADAYASDEVKTTGGFEDGRRWAKTIKDLIRKDKVKPSIDALYRLKLDGMTPTDCVLTYAFSRYLQSTVGRLANYATLAERVETSNQIPEPIELAKIYGFKSVKELEDDWIAYMAGSSFR